MDEVHKPYKRDLQCPSGHLTEAEFTSFRAFETVMQHKGRLANFVDHTMSQH